MITNCLLHDKNNTTKRGYVKNVRFPMYGMNMFTVQVEIPPDENGNTIAQYIVPGFMVELDDDVESVKSFGAGVGGKIEAIDNPVFKLKLYDAEKFAHESGAIWE